MVFSWSWEAHISHLQQVFDRVRLANLKPNIRKCEFPNAKLDFLGHTLSLNMVQLRQQKVEALLKFPAPNNKKQVQSLLGLAGYYRKFLPHFADLTLPLTSLLKKNTSFRWSEAANAAFMDLKSRFNQYSFIWWHNITTDINATVIYMADLGCSKAKYPECPTDNHIYRA